jgi:hypothetical protein
MHVFFLFVDKFYKKKNFIFLIKKIYSFFCKIEEKIKGDNLARMGFLITSVS